MICPNCGNTAVEGAAFCSSCGSPLPQETPAAAPETTSATTASETEETAASAATTADAAAPVTAVPEAAAAAAPIPPDSAYQQSYEQPDANQAAYQQFDQTTYQQYGQAGYQQAGTYPAQQPMGYQQPMYGQPIAAPPTEKSKVAAGLLGIFLGALGIHKFYLGYTKAGVIMLLVSLLTLGIGAIVMDIIGIIEGILYLTKNDWEFYNTYVVGEKDWF